MIDFRLKKQYVNGFYIYKYKDRVTFGKNGTSNHFSLKIEDFKDLKDLKLEILRTIRRDKNEN